jgi:glycosyltransferase involved in cell wall biosynthesis
MMSPTVWHIGSDDVHMRIPLLLALRERGFAVGAVGSEQGEAFQSHAIPYWRYSLDRGINPIADLRSIRELTRLLRQHKPNIVHAFDTKPIMFVPMATKKAGVCECIRTVTGMGYVFSSTSPLAYALRPVYRLLHQWAARATEMTIFQNPDDRDYFLRNDMARAGHDALVLGSGIDIRSLLNRSLDDESLRKLRGTLRLDDQIVVTMVARMVKYKGVMEYIKAAARVRQQFNNVTFLLVGPVASEGSQAVSAKALEEAAEHVQYLGPRDDVPMLLALSDIFVLPSYYREGIPRVLLEAAAMGLPLITTDMPGCKEVVREGWNGLLVPPRSVEALSNALTRLLSSSRERTTMGINSNSHIDQFDLSHVADQYAEIYHCVLNQTQRDTHQEAKTPETAI